MRLRVRKSLRDFLKSRGAPFALGALEKQQKEDRYAYLIQRVELFLPTGCVHAVDGNIHSVHCKRIFSLEFCWCTFLVRLRSRPWCDGHAKFYVQSSDAINLFPGMMESIPLSACLFLSLNLCNLLIYFSQPILSLPVSLYLSLHFVYLTVLSRHTGCAKRQLALSRRPSAASSHGRRLGSGGWRRSCSEGGGPRGPCSAGVDTCSHPAG